MLVACISFVLTSLHTLFCRPFYFTTTHYFVCPVISPLISPLPCHFCYFTTAHFTIAMSFLLCQVMRRHAHEPFIDESSNAMPVPSKRLMHGMKYMRASSLEPHLRAIFLSYLFWYGAHDAGSQLLWETSWSILRILQQKIDQTVCPSSSAAAAGPSYDHAPPPGSPSSSSPSSALKFPYSSDDLFIQELVCRLCGGEKTRSLVMIEELLLRASPAAYGTGNIGLSGRSGDGMIGGGSPDWMAGSPRRGSSPATTNGDGGGGGTKEKGSLVLSEDVIATLTRLEKAVFAEANGAGRLVCCAVLCCAVLCCADTSTAGANILEIESFLTYLHSVLNISHSYPILSFIQHNRTVTTPLIYLFPGNSIHNDKQPWRQYSESDRLGGNAKGDTSNAVVGGPSSSSHPSSSASTYDQDIKLLGIAFRLPVFKRGLGPSGSLPVPGLGPVPGQGPGSGLGPGPSGIGISSSTSSSATDHLGVVAKGSTLPGTRARQQHFRISALTQRPLQGVSVKFNLRNNNIQEKSSSSAAGLDSCTYAGINEVLAWKRVLPFAPNFTGDPLD